MEKIFLMAKCYEIKLRKVDFVSKEILNGEKKYKNDLNNLLAILETFYNNYEVDTSTNYIFGNAINWYSGAIYSDDKKKFVKTKIDCIKKIIEFTENNINSFNLSDSICKFFDFVTDENLNCYTCFRKEFKSFQKLFSNKKILQYLNSLEFKEKLNKPELINFNLDSLTIIPLQRFLRYKMLLESYIGALKKEHHDDVEMSYCVAKKQILSLASNLLDKE